MAPPGERGDQGWAEDSPDYLGRGLRARAFAANSRENKSGDARNNPALTSQARGRKPNPGAAGTPAGGRMGKERRKRSVRRTRSLKKRALGVASTIKEP